MNWRLASFLVLCLGGIASQSSQVWAQASDDSAQSPAEECKEFKSGIELLTKKIEVLENPINSCDCAPKAKAEPCPGSSTCSRSSIPIQIPLCPGQLKNVSVTFRVRHIPLDVYYLIWSTDWIEKKIYDFTQSSDDLRQALATMSVDHTLGFGTFIDKPGKKYKKEKRYYSFHNSYPLSPDTSGFKSALKAVDLLAMTDYSRDSRLEAIYQAVICPQIGWRPHSRHLLVVISGFTYAAAGFGKNFVPPITKPFDGRCHLNGGGYYSEQLTMDYPSMNQIQDVIKRSQTNLIIHALHGSPENSMKEVLPAPAKASSPDNSNLVNQLVTKYKIITGKVELEPTMTSPEISVSYFSNCNGKEMRETKVCEDIGEGDTVTFEVQFELKKCPKDCTDWNQDFSLGVAGLSQSQKISLQLRCGD